MGSGSSRSSGAQRRRGPHSPAAPERGSGAAAAVEKADAAPDPAEPPDGRAEALRLLDLLLAESEAWGAGGPAGSPPKASSGQQAEDDTEGSRASEAPSDSPKRVARRSSISYSQAEEELMASIEREYGC